VNLPTCSLSILVARTDIPFMMHTIPHLVKGCDFQFAERILFLDTAPLTGDKVGRPGIGTLEQLRNCCQQLIVSGTVDKVIDIDYSEHYRKQVYRKHFGYQHIRPTHNYKGYPILGTIFSLEAPPGDYIVHFDSDMLLYQAPGFSWIKKGIEILETHPEVISVRPLAGPPLPEGGILQKHYGHDPDGFYKFKFFGSRAYLMNRRRFDSLLPLPVQWKGYKNKSLNALPNPLKTVLNSVFGRGKLDSWEIMVSNRIAHAPYFRANLSSPESWTVHPKDRGSDYIQALPEIIQRIESGWYPQEQAGQYDLYLAPWLSAIYTDLEPEETVSSESL
jgi:hypothetical protein